MSTTTSPHDSISVLGHAVQRREDPGFLDGSATYVADLVPEGGLHAHFVRSTSAHARITGLSTAAAARAPGVVAVLTAADLDLPPAGEFPPPEEPRPVLGRPCLAGDRVRFVGEPIAVVVAETRAAAVDAAELIEVDYEDLPAVADPAAALRDDAPLLFPDHGSNVVIDIHTTTGQPDVLEGAELRVRGRFHNQRVAPAPMEPHGILVVPEPGDHLTIRVSTQAPFQVRGAICAALHLAPDAVRVVVPAVGGGFGAKGGAAMEHLVVAAAARRLDRPVFWQETRSENFTAMTHGRGQLQDVEVGARRDGTVVGMRATTVTEAGAYVWRAGIPTRTSRIMATGVYRIPRLDLRSQAVVTNTTPIGPYRGAGRPEAAAMLERVMDLLAAELDLDPAEVRRRNLLRPDEFPYRTPSGASYDSGDYQGALDRALAIAGYDGLRKEQAERRRRGDPTVLGIGLSTFVEVSGSGSEYGSVRIGTDGKVTVISGTSPHGQGHETTLAQVAASVLDVPLEVVRVVHSDTGVVARGVGTFGSRSGQLGGGAVFEAGQQVLDQARSLAAELLEAAPEDIGRADGGFCVVGVPARTVSWADLAIAAEAVGAPSDGSGPAGLAAEADFAQADGTFPFGAHVAVVDVDTETGSVALRRLVAVDDCGTVVNPMIVAGQVHGGLAQGVAQALFEEVRYDEAGTPLTTTFMDYMIPSAADLPMWELGETHTPSPRNPLGVKGVGEAGAVGSTAAVQNAVLDALRPFGVDHLDPPLSPVKIWEALRTAAAG